MEPPVEPPAHAEDRTARREPSGPEASRRWSIWLTAAPAAFFGLLVLATLFLMWTRDPPPALTAERLAAARSLWAAHGLEDYTIEVQVLGRQPALYRLEVRSGEVVDFTMNGQAPKRPGSWDAWTIPGQFDLLSQELSNAASPDVSFGAPPQAAVLQHCAFDPQRGYPLRYSRVIPTTDLSLSWSTRWIAP